MKKTTRSPRMPKGPKESMEPKAEELMESKMPLKKRKAVEAKEAKGYKCGGKVKK